MADLTFTQATKDQAKARIALTGPSGSGKTYTALTLAATLGERVALVDTERGSASKYADEFSFDTLQLTSFEPTTLVKALAAASSQGYDVVIVDSLTHFWSGTGGMLEQVDHAAKRLGSKSNFAGWKEARPMERAMVDALLAYPGHVIVTMRAKTEYVVEDDERGRKVPRKVGLKPEQRDGIEYELDIVGELDLDNTLVISKSRAKALAGLVVSRPGAELAEQIAAWLGDGKPAPTAEDIRVEALGLEVTYVRMRELYEDARRRGLLAAAVLDDRGEPSTLGDVLVIAGNKLKAVGS